MSMHNIHLLCRNIDTTNIAHSKLPHQTTHLDKEDSGKPKPEHKRSNLAKTDPIKASKDANFDSKPPTLLVKILELLELRISTPLPTAEGRETDGTNTLSKTISELTPMAEDADTIEGEAKKKIPMIPNWQTSIFSKYWRLGQPKAPKNISKTPNNHLNQRQQENQELME
ncbi:hypothetical protein G9A89_017046 [Geosiphon pyriformis]|nr:hypothetical protein G9A89_017046 [Geosiphon pyriformis]